MDAHESTAKQSKELKNKYQFLGENFIPSDFSDPTESGAIKVVINENTKGTLRCNLLELSTITGISDRKNVHFTAERRKELKEK